MIEPLYESEELGELISFIDFLVEFSELYNNLDEVTHDVREDGNSEHQNEETEKPLVVTLGMVVTKSDGGKRGEGVVDDGPENADVLADLLWVFVSFWIWHTVVWVLHAVRLKVEVLDESDDVLVCGVPNLLRSHVPFLLDASGLPILIWARSTLISNCASFWECVITLINLGLQVANDVEEDAATEEEEERAEP